MIDEKIRASLFPRQVAERLFDALCREPGVFTAPELVAAVWPDADGGPLNAEMSLYAAAWRLRRVLRASGLPLTLVTEPGRWRLVIGSESGQGARSLETDPETAPPAKPLRGGAAL
jgi:hypothetical protein